jgi:hypothetical protein
MDEKTIVVRSKIIVKLRPADQLPRGRGLLNFAISWKINFQKQNLRKSHNSLTVIDMYYVPDVNKAQKTCLGNFESPLFSFNSRIIKSSYCDRASRHTFPWFLSVINQLLFQVAYACYSSCSAPDLNSSKLTPSNYLSKHCNSQLIKKWKIKTSRPMSITIHEIPNTK